MLERWVRSLVVLAGVALLGCGEAAETPAPPDASAPAAAAELPADLPNVLLLALSTFDEGADGKPVPRSELMVLTRRGGAWQARSYTDPESNVFHKAMAWTPPGQSPALVTLGGSAAAVKLWRKGEAGLAPVETLWQADFGGKFSRMRDAEVGDLDGDGQTELAIATHDQGVVAVLRMGAGGKAEVSELDREADTFVHEIELGDLDRDGRPEIYATPSEPNRLDGTPQPGQVVSYRAGEPGSRRVVADLGDRHAKEILAGDVDGDGTDELYVASDKQRELRRYVWVSGSPVREVIYRREKPQAILTWNIAPVPGTLVD